jgi:hypothetical protein
VGFLFFADLVRQSNGWLNAIAHMIRPTKNLFGNERLHHYITKTHIFLHLKSVFKVPISLRSIIAQSQRTKLPSFSCGCGTKDEAASATAPSILSAVFQVPRMQVSLIPINYYYYYYYYYYYLALQHFPMLIIIRCHSTIAYGGKVSMAELSSTLFSSFMFRSN